MTSRSKHAYIPASLLTSDTGTSALISTQKCVLQKKIRDAETNTYFQDKPFYAGWQGQMAIFRTCR